MSWEDRGVAEPYYYRKVRRAGGRVESVYVGKGLIAECVAEIDGAVRAARRYHAEAARLAEAVLDGAGSGVEALTGSVRSRLDRHMVGLGLRYHRGEWRRPRAGSTSATPGLARVSTVSPSTGRRLSQVRTESQEALADAGRTSEMVIDDFPARFAEQDSNRDILIRLALCDARGLRVMAERAVLDGEGNREHPVFQFLRDAARTVVSQWNGVVVDARDFWGLSYLERRQHRSRIAYGRAAALGPHDGRAGMAAVAVAAILDEVDQDGRAALSAAVQRARTAFDWAHAAPLGRDIIDQYALAQAHTDLVEAFASRSSSVPNKPRTSETDDDPASKLIAAVTAVLGPEACPWATTKTHDPETTTPASAAAWDRRTRRARRRLSDAHRLVQHARKVGLVRDGVEADPGQYDEHTESELHDELLAALVRPAPLEPLQGAAASMAARTRAHIEAQREAWPPPPYMLWSQLRDLSCPWWTLYYTDCCTAPDGTRCGSGVWARLSRMPDHPDMQLAELADWAPDCAEPTWDSSSVSSWHPDWKLDSAQTGAAHRAGLP